MDQIKLFKKGQKKFSIVLSKTVQENNLPPKPVEIIPVDFNPYIENAIADMEKFNMNLIQMMRKIEKEVLVECGHAQGDDEKQPTKRLAMKKRKRLIQKSSQGDEKEEDNETEILSTKRDI